MGTAESTIASASPSSARRCAGHGSVPMTAVTSRLVRKAQSTAPRTPIFASLSLAPWKARAAMSREDPTPARVPPAVTAHGFLALAVIGLSFRCARQAWRLRAGK
ncbi:hypothetical protein SAZ11_02600 [Streptomyces sp. FXJ1.4098]|uniref:hypothetical protein n=1 Tax=Streptomyces sp. NPDC020845 TaxID=3365096 RepID=UPI0029996E54|nr:hypothetical protein [Streptomyces sp. FXJ1.4098]